MGRASIVAFRSAHRIGPVEIAFAANDPATILIMKSIIVGTAGHIDHGKTALVKALTGIDADRLEEEKRRGITIDLGFAHMDLPGAGGETLHLGFVDVPGHERFVRNMLAGVGGIDLVLLVIAADESIKPQTREHFDILRLLGVQRGITVLTKSDAVDAETLDVVRLEVEEFLRGTFLEPPKSPIVAVSALTGAGLDDLKGAIVAAAAEVQPRDSQALARLPIDRVFTMKGFGTVVTGTLVAGTIRREEELEVLPSSQRVRVRGVQVHGHATEFASAGQRTALNLAGASTEDLSRGMTLAPPATFSTTRRVDVRLRLLGFGAARAEKSGAGPLPFQHHGDGRGNRSSRHEATCSRIGGVRPAEVSGAGASASWGSFHCPPVLSGRDYRRRRCARCYPDPAHARTRTLSANPGRRRSGNNSHGPDRQARTWGNFDGATCRRDWMEPRFRRVSIGSNVESSARVAHRRIICRRSDDRTTPGIHRALRLLTFTRKTLWWAGWRGKRCASR